jgi:hypothetical protein
MKPVQRAIVTVIVVVVVGSIYYSFIKPTDELGDFSKFTVGNEINQRINVGLVHSRGFTKDAGGGIVSFVGVDRHGTEVLITLHDPTTLAVENATVVELMGHMHQESFVASEISVVK